MCTIGARQTALDMENEYIKTFLTTAKLSSFSKASQALYLTPNAVKKRISSFEKELGVTLFIRTNRGVQLTKAGELLYCECQLLAERYKTAVQQARNIAEREKRCLHIGMSDTFSDIFLSSNWLDTKAGNLKITHLIRYGNTIDDLSKMFSEVGRESDLVIDICDQKIADKYRLQMVPVSEFSAYVGLPSPCYDAEERKSRLNASTIDVLFKGRSTSTDQMITDTITQYPKAKIREIPDLHFWTIQESLERGDCILVPGDLKRIFPNYHFYEIHLAAKVSFGFYYRSDREDIRSFIKMVKER